MTFQFRIIYYGSMKIGKWHPSGYILLGAKGLLPFLLLTLIALYSITHLKIDFSLISELPENHVLQDKINTERQYFQTNGDFIFAMSTEISDLSEGTLHKMGQIIYELEQLPSVGFVVSPLNIQDLKMMVTVGPLSLLR